MQRNLLHRVKDTAQQLQRCVIKSQYSSDCSCLCMFLLEVECVCLWRRGGGLQTRESPHYSQRCGCTGWTKPSLSPPYVPK